MRSKGVLFIVVLVLGISLTLPSTSSAWSGWGWGPAAFLGGVLVGSVIARPYYAPAPVYVYPSPAVAYGSPPPPAQVYAYPSPPLTPPPEAKGQWVEVPGQTVNGQWVPPHKAWVPDSQ
jgi:hypothetical protein